MAGCIPGLTGAAGRGMDTKTQARKPAHAPKVANGLIKWGKEKRANLVQGARFEVIDG